MTKLSIDINFKETWAEYVARLEPHERQELEFILRKRRRDFDENISLDPKNAMRNKPPNWVRVEYPGFKCYCGFCVHNSWIGVKGSCENFSKLFSLDGFRFFEA